MALNIKKILEEKLEDARLDINREVLVKIIVYINDGSYLQRIDDLILFRNFLSEIIEKRSDFTSNQITDLNNFLNQIKILINENSVKSEADRNKIVRTLGMLQAEFIGA